MDLGSVTKICFTVVVVLVVVEVVVVDVVVVVVDVVEVVEVYKYVSLLVVYSWSSNVQLW